MDFLEKPMKILESYSLCDSCFGRQYGNLGTGLTNEKRGKALKTTLLLKLDSDYKKRKKIDFEEKLKNIALTNHKPAEKTLIKKYKINLEKEKPCYLCKGILSVDFYYQVCKKIEEEIQNLEFTTFLIGSKFPSSILEREDNLRTNFSLEFGESIKSEFNREFGKYLLDTVLSDKQVEFKSPDIVFIINIDNLQIELQRKSLYVYGKYKKLVRGIPQATWHCSNCRGAGCDKCNNTGLLYPTSIQKMVEEPLLQLTGSNESKFHGSGREDIDAKMLGSGRPFVIELLLPKTYELNLEKATKMINHNSDGKIEVELEKIVEKKDVRMLKSLSTSMKKKYRMIVDTEEPIKHSQSQLNEIARSFHDTIIYQKTPSRVIHRRSDLVRERKVYNMVIEKKSRQSLRIEVVGQGGLYVKELVSGDNGRTNPNISEKLGVQAVCSALDVLAVYNVYEKQLDKKTNS